MRKIIGLVVFIFTFISCKQDAKTDVDVEKIDVEVIVDRFEQKFYTMNEASYPKLKLEYPFLFPPQTSDSIWLEKSNNKEELELLKLTEQVFGDFKEQKEELEVLFKHIKYYHPTFEAPKVISLITNLDYQNKVMYVDSLLFVSLDMYLGKESPVYRDFPEYLAKNFDKKQLMVDIAKAIGERYSLQNRSRQFVELMVGEGKKLYQTEQYLPTYSEGKIMGYTEDEIAWVEANEEQLWKYFIENNLLYSTDYQLVNRFIENAPFSKFYINIDKESPGRIGVWLGLKIVQSYMKNNNVTLQELMNASEEDIFKKSKYKPKK